jgi:hypothetical protein
LRLTFLFVVQNRLISVGTRLSIGEWDWRPTLDTLLSQLLNRHRRNGRRSGGTRSTSRHDRPRAPGHT